MKKQLIFVCFLILFFPTITQAQKLDLDLFLEEEERFNNDCLNRLTERSDTLSLYELHSYWQKNKNYYDLEFAISSTKCSSLLNYGIFWPSGETVVLPANNDSYVWLDCQNDKLVLIWNEKDKCEIKMHFSYLNDLKIKDISLPRIIKIYAF